MSPPLAAKFSRAEVQRWGICEGRVRGEHSISLFFVNEAEPILVKTTYRSSCNTGEILSVRGKTGGAFDTERTFQWTAAVQGLCVILLKRASASNPGDDITIAGGQGSLAASLDYALDKQPAWLADMFGIAPDGNTIARKLFRRTNPGRKSKGPVVIGIHKSVLPGLNIEVVVDGNTVASSRAISEIFRRIEQPGSPPPIDSIPMRRINDYMNQSSSHGPAEADLFKTPFVLRHAHQGSAFTRLYQHGGSTFFVACFCHPGDLPDSTPTPVRLQFDCPASSVFDWADCDCSTQLDEALETLQKEKGILVYLVPENSATSLFSSYLAGIEANRSIFSSSGPLSASRHQSRDLSATYDVVTSILRDLTVSDCALLTNNSQKVEQLRARGLMVTPRSLSPIVTPQNLGFLFAQMGNDLADHLVKVGEIAHCISPARLHDGRRTWIIAGEDTLWEDNIYYEDLIRKFIDHIALYLGEQSRFKIRNILDACSAANTKKNGYGPRVFEQTLKLAWNALRQFYGEHFRVPYPMHLIDRAAETLLQIPIRVHPEGEALLWKIREAGENAVLFTQGPLEVQLYKTAQLHITPFFDAVAYVSHKTKDTFTQLLKALDLSPQNVVVVGNNLSSEIKPAIELGVNAVHYDNPNGWANLSRTLLPSDNYRKIRSLRELHVDFGSPSLCINPAPRAVLSK